MESRFFCEEHGEELEVENVTSRGGDVYIFVAPCKQCTAQQSVEQTACRLGENAAHIGPFLVTPEGLSKCDSCGCTW